MSTHNLCFRANKKNNDYNPQFYYIKAGFLRGSKLYRHVFVLGLRLLLMTKRSFWKKKKLYAIYGSKSLLLCNITIILFYIKQTKVCYNNVNFKCRNIKFSITFQLFQMFSGLPVIFGDFMGQNICTSIKAQIMIKLLLIEHFRQVNQNQNFYWLYIQ